MSFILLFKKPAFWIPFAIFACIEVAVRILPAHYGEGAGIFLTNQRKILAESEYPEFDYVILGDSRSLSLMGHPPTQAEPYSIYNFSLPALGSNYYRFMLDKILRNRKNKPAAVIFAADPQAFFVGYDSPINDPERLYTDSHQTTLVEYIRNRITRRLSMVFYGRDKVAPEHPVFTREMLWDFFSHRYLHLFDPGEILNNYSGPERVFLLKESLPLVYRTYKYRDAVRGLPSTVRSLVNPEKPLPDICNTCDGVVNPVCHPKTSNYTGNMRIAQGLLKRYGQINLGDRLTPVERIGYLSIRESQVEMQIKALNKARPDLKLLKEFIEYALSEGVKVIITDVPPIDRYKDTQYHKLYYPAVEELIERYPDVKMIRFPRKYYPLEYYVEQVHYECKGAGVLNRDFYKSVIPEILKFAPPSKDKRIRSFEQLSKIKN